MNRNGTMKPNFFIVGAPRCGTTALSTYLAQHPAICFSRPKEPHYFTQLPALDETRLQQDYLDRYFQHYNENHRAVGEGSVSYLYSPQVIEHILRYNPDARFIAMVRNPLDMLRSYHAQLLFTLDEDVEDFATAWALQGLRARGIRLPRTCRDPRLLQYTEVGKLGKYLEQLLSVAGHDRVFTVVYDDLAARTGQTYSEILRFLDVPDDGRQDFPRIKSSKGYRWRWLHLILKRPPAEVAKHMQAIKSAAKSKNRNSRLLRARKRLIELNTVGVHRDPLDPGMQRVMADTFRSDIEKLGQLLGRDLSAWLPQAQDVVTQWEEHRQNHAQSVSG